MSAAHSLGPAAVACVAQSDPYGESRDGSQHPPGNALSVGEGGRLNLPRQVGADRIRSRCRDVDELEAFDLDDFKLFQVALREIESRCGLTFDPLLKAADSVGERLARQPEALSRRKPVASLQEIDWS